MTTQASPPGILCRPPPSPILVSNGNPKSAPFLIVWRQADVPAPRRYLWYLAVLVLFLFALRNPDAAAHLARECAHLLALCMRALWKLAGVL